MPPSSPDRSDPSAGHESFGRARNLYLVEMVLGGAVLLLIALIFFSANGPNESGEHVVKLTSANWRKEVAESSVPVLVDFWAPWCGPCRQLTPTIDRLAIRYAGKIKVASLNVDDAQDIAERYGVESIPRVLIFKGGEQPRKMLVGLTSEAKIVEAIESVLQ